MKKIIIVMLSLCMLFATTPLMAADGAAVQKRDDTSLSQQDQCLLYSKSCMNQADSLQDKMRKLDAEIKKGTAKYTPEQLRILEKKLKDANDNLDLLLRN